MLCPGTVAIVVPALILLGSGSDVVAATAVPGALLFLIGLALVASCIRLFVTVGRGTLAP